MAGSRRWTYAKWTVVGLCAIVLAVMAISLVMQGPVTVYRIVAHGDSTIEDYKLYPFRALAASPRPFRFTEALRSELTRVAIDGRGEIDLVEFLEQSNTIAFLVIQGDRLQFERYFRGHDKTKVSQVFSVSKSILSILIGTAIDDGLIGSVEDVVTKYVPQLASGGFAKVRIVDLLQMNSGMEYRESDNPFGQHVRFNYTPNLEAEILALHVRSLPDDRFVYKSGENALLGLILERALKGKTITQYAQERLWTPLGMEYGGLWSLDREAGLERTWCCVSLTARDLAKIGVLYRDGGKWQGHALVSKKWVDDSTGSGPYPAGQWRRSEHGAGFWNYGYQWWLVDKTRGDFTALGKGGQFLYVDAAKGVVVVRLGYDMGKPGGRVLNADDWLRLFQALADKSASLRATEG